jgi:exosome complex RNA-binding protein Rrp42 (RNase PH superfamily)
MDVLSVVDPALLYSKYATRGIRPDARLPAASRPLALLQNVLSSGSDACATCMARLGGTTVLAAVSMSTPRASDAAAPTCRVTVRVPAVAGGGGGGSRGPLSEAGALLQAQLAAIYGCGTVDANSLVQEDGLDVTANLDVLLLADDGGLLDAAAGAATVALYHAVTAAGARLQLLRLPAACTVGVVRAGGEEAGGGSGMWAVVDPSLSNGEGQHATALALSGPQGGGAAATGGFSTMTGPTPVAATPARTGGVRTLGGAGLAAAHVHAVVDARLGSDVVLALDISQGAAGLQACNAGVLAQAIEGARARAAVIRAQVKE